MKKNSGILQHIFTCLVVLFIVSNVNADYRNYKTPAPPSIEGRWDMTININGKSLPSWLEVRHSGFHMLVGEFVGTAGSARPVSRVNFTDGKISFTVPPQWEQGDNDLSFEGILQGDSLSGTMTSADGKNYNWSAVRAPLLHRDKEPSWGTPIHLFNGKDM